MKLNSTDTCRVVFAGTPEFAVPFVEAITADTNYKIVGVITQPDRPTGRKQLLTPPPVKTWALANDIPILQPEKMRGNDDVLQKIKDLKPDYLVVVAFGLLIPTEILQIPTHGTINVHPSLLPRHRGASPIQSAILTGDETTGVSIMLLDEQMDHGPVLAQKEIKLNGTETAESLQESCIEIGALLLIETMGGYAAGTIKAQMQNDELATYCKMITRDEARIDWQKSATEIDRQIRAYYPWPVAWTTIDDKRLKIFPPVTLQTANNDLPAGTLYLNENQAFVACGTGRITLSDVQIEGRKSQSAIIYTNSLPTQKTLI